MRTIESAGSFKRDYKRVKASPRHGKGLDTLLPTVLELLCRDAPLPEKYRGQTLSGDWSGYRECHLRPDLLLIYRKPDANTLRLARLGSHGELFG